MKNTDCDKDNLKQIVTVNNLHRAVCTRKVNLINDMHLKFFSMQCFTIASVPVIVDLDMDLP